MSRENKLRKGNWTEYFNGYESFHTQSPFTTVAWFLSNHVIDSWAGKWHPTKNISYDPDLNTLAIEIPGLGHFYDTPSKMIVAEPVISIGKGVSKIIYIVGANLILEMRKKIELRQILFLN